VAVMAVNAWTASCALVIDLSLLLADASGAASGEGRCDMSFMHLSYAELLV
jgi:hypothetical protein